MGSVAGPQPDQSDDSFSTLGTLQGQVAEWHRREFPCDDPADEQLMAQALVLAEEVGEVCRCIVKARQGIRGGRGHWDAELRKEMGDVVIALCAVADMAGFDLGYAVLARWASVGARRFATADEASHA